MLETGVMDAGEAIRLFGYGTAAVLVRLSILMFLLPGIGELAIPVPIRMALVLALTAAIVPSVLPTQLGYVQTTDIVALLAFESVIGFALGFGFRLLIFALTITGTIISQSASLSQIFGPGINAEPNPSVSTFLVLAATAVFVSLDFHTYTVGLIMESYDLFPLGDLPESGALAKWATDRTGAAFNLAVSLALPFILISFLYYIVLGLMNQAMPQMMVTFIGVPANVLAGLVVLVLATTTILTVWLRAAEEAFGGFW